MLHHISEMINPAKKKASHNSYIYNTADIFPGLKMVQLFSLLMCDLHSCVMYLRLNYEWEKLLCPCKLSLGLGEIPAIKGYTIYKVELMKPREYETLCQ